MTRKSLVLWGIGLVIAGIILLTGVALLLERNPPVVQEPAWDSPQTRALAVRACFDCHSNQTQWPWYDKMPVGSWIAVFDTLRGRSHVNFSEWGVRPTGGGEGGEGRGGREMQHVIQDGSMPPALYTAMHPNAVLTDAEKQQLITGLQNSLK